MRNILPSFLAFFFLLAICQAQSDLPVFSYLDVFELEWASDPQISPDGEQVVYRRMGFDILKDRAVGQLWIINTDGTGHQKLTSREVSESSPRWSPSGDRIAFVSSTDEGAEIYVYWVETGHVARLSHLPASPSSLTWSPDGNHLAFSMKVAEAPPVIAKMPPRPDGAQWAASPRITDRLKHEADGAGYVAPGFYHLFVLTADGGTARQVTQGDFQHRGPIAWSPDGKLLYFSGNLIEDWEYDYRNSEVYSVLVTTGETTALTSRQGPDHHPIVAPHGKTIAYLGYEDKVQTYQVTKLHLMNADGSNQRTILDDLDRSIADIQWNEDGTAIYFTYDDHGSTKVAVTSLQGEMREITRDLGGTSIGRPYPGGSYSVSNDGLLTLTYTDPERPAEVVITDGENIADFLTHLNDDVLQQRTLGLVEEVTYPSSYDGRTIQGWIVKPPNYDPEQTYPLLVENHGGPVANYGNRFSAEMQLYAAAGYLVFYPNPRGSTSYGEEFGNLLYNNYPGQDYNDVMDGVDYLLGEGLVDEEQLYVTGGSAGGIMTAWIIGNNNRFRAAVVAKPVVNWISKTLVADNYFNYADYRYPGQPWENFEGYWKFSPISLVANIETPTMVMVGMDDLRTPPSEAKQLYHALKLRRIETVLVEIPEASHGIAARPSNLITKIAHTVAWFERYRE